MARQRNQPSQSAQSADGNSVPFPKRHYAGAKYNRIRKADER